MEKEKTERQSDQTKSHPLIPLDLLKNFNEALHMITTPKILSKLSEAIKQKLQFLSNGIFSSESLQNQLANKETPIELKELFKKSPLFIKYSEKDLIKENLSEEFLNLSNLGIEIKLDLFIKTALQISPELQNILLSPNAKKGFLHVKFPGTLKSWHNKFLILDISKKMLFFLKEIKSLSPERGLKLEGYAIRWVGKSKSKFCFSILSPNIKPKCILFGGEQEKLIKEWYESLKNVMNQNGSFFLNKTKYIISPHKLIKFFSIQL